LVEYRSNKEFSPPINEIDGGYALDFFAHPDAFAAKNALVRITDDARTRHVESFALYPVTMYSSLDTELLGKLLQLAGSAAGTIEAVIWMVGEQKFQDGAPRLDYTGRFRFDAHPFGDGMRTGRDEVGHALHLYHAHPTGTGGNKIFHKAKRGYIKAFFL
jgi:hypothetical protein